MSSGFNQVLLKSGSQKTSVIHKNGVFMNKIIISLICCLLPTFVLADTLQIREDAPDRHVVVKGDTLWDISAKFLKDPWLWPKIWAMNKDIVEDPHWIFPGEIIVLDRTTNTLSVARPIVTTNGKTAGDSGATGDGTGSGGSGIDLSGAVKLSPGIRVERSAHDAIPSIPASAIRPFLNQPLVIEEDGLENAPVIVGTFEQRVLLGDSDIAYVQNLPQDKGIIWQVYRPGKALVDPETDDILGYEANYLGNAAVEKFADISTLRITDAVQEIRKGDRLTYATRETPSNYMPRAPEKEIIARIVSIYGEAGRKQAGQYSVVTINKGQRDGLENGHVLALYRKGEVLKQTWSADITLPDVRYGLLFVFGTFEKLSYALVMQTRLPVELQDSARTP